MECKLLSSISKASQKSRSNKTFTNYGIPECIAFKINLCIVHNKRFDTNEQGSRSGHG